MDKSTFLKKIAEKAGITKEAANQTLKAVVEVIVSEVRDNGETIAINGLGTFKQKTTEARQGRNPLNGETVNIAASKTVVFKAQPSVKIKL